MGRTGLRYSSRTSATSEAILRWGFLFNLTISSSFLAWVLVSSNSIRIGVLLLPSLFVVLIVGDSGEENMTLHNSPSLLLERVHFCCSQILIFQLNRLRLLPFLSWSLPQRDSWTFFLKDFHHASGVNVSFSSRLLWLHLRNPSKYPSDYIVHGRSTYLNFDPPLKRFVQ